MREYNILVDKPNLLPNSGIVHTATSWEIRSSPDVTLDNNILHQSMDNSTNLYQYKVQLDTKDDDVVYVRTKLHFGTSASKWSNIVSVKGNQQGYKLSNIIVATPTTSYAVSITSDLDTKLYLRTSAFRLYLGYGKHVATKWSITDTDGRIS